MIRRENKEAAGDSSTMDEAVTNQTSTKIESAVPPHLVKLQYSLRRAFQLLITAGNPEIALYELPVAQFRCLRRIMDQDGCKLVDLAKETNLSLPNASRLVDRLVQRGLVSRLTDPRDRRAVRLHATPTAIDMLNTITFKQLEHLEKATKSLSFEQIEESIKQLHILIDEAEKYSNSRPSIS